MNETTDVAAVLAPIWKRKWLILAVGILVAAASYGYYKRQPSRYSSTTELYLGAGSEQQVLPGEKEKAGTNIADQVALINSGVLTQVVRQQLRKENNQALAGAARRGTVHAAAAGGGKSEKSNFLLITAEAHGARPAALLANVVAYAYIKRQRASYQRSVTAAIAITRQQLRRIEAAREQASLSTSSTSKGKGSSKSSPSVSVPETLDAASLSSKINQLEADLSVVRVQQITPAKAAVLLSPHPKTNAIFGFVVGIVLASVAAFALGRFDRRLRSLTNIEATFQTQILTALPAVRQPVVHRDGHPAPANSLREPLRRLHTTLQLTKIVEHEREASHRLLLFLSADAGDGRSTVIADLALVQADAGERVAVIEADLRRPVQARLLDLSGPQGLAEVLAGTLAVGEAMQTVAPADQAVSANSAGSAGGGVTTVVESSSAGSVSVLVGGGEVANPPALLGRRTMTDLLRSVAEDFDYVLIDAPPPLEVSDVMPMLDVVDGIVIVARVGHTRDISAQRLVQLLTRASSAPVLGIVANSASRTEIERYGFLPVLDARGWRRMLVRG